MSLLNDELLQLIAEAQHILVIQPENPDGDSLGTALGLEDIFSEMGKQVSLYCAVDMPKYLRYLAGWDRVTNEPPHAADLVVIVDTLSATLLSKALAVPALRHLLEVQPVIALDHHAEVTSDLPFSHHQVVDGAAVATAELVAQLAETHDWALTPAGAAALAAGLLADSLGLTTSATTAASIRTYASLVEKGASPSAIETARRELTRKTARILQFKGQLIGRIEYYLEGRLAVVPITWEDIREYSDQYNPSILVLDEMRLVSGVEVAVAIKTYPDGKLTGKLRSNQPVSDTIAGTFGGGGHAHSAGFRVYEGYDAVLEELVKVTASALAAQTDSRG